MEFNGWGGGGRSLVSTCFELAVVHRPDYCRAYWEAINILVALHVFFRFCLRSRGHYMV
jgi:hypothetical protein